MSTRKPTRWYWKFARVILACYLVWLGIVYLAQPRLLFPASMAGSARAELDVREGEMVWITGDGGGGGARVEAWFLPGAGCTAKKPGPVVMFFHGNGEIIEQNLPLARWYASRGISVLMPEYRGYGRSGGSPSESAIVGDMERFHDDLVRRPEVDRSRVVFHGRSLGGGVAAALAVGRPTAALILESSFTSVASYAWKFGVPPFLCRSPFRTDKVVGTLGRPILILHGADDDMIPPRHGRRLHELAPGSTYVELAGGHNDFPRDRDEYESRVLEFLRTAGVLAGE